MRARKSIGSWESTPSRSSSRRSKNSGCLDGVDRATAAEIVAALPAGVEAVGLFVDRPPQEVAELAARLSLRIVQLHGQEPPEDLLVLRHLVIVRAFRLGDVRAVARMSSYLNSCRAL